MTLPAPLHDVTIDRSSTVPPSLQLSRGIRQAAGGGRLVVGAKLPTVRALARDAGLAVNTVAKVYRELEADGVIVTQGRNGTFVATGDSTQAQAADAARQFAERMGQLGIARDEALSLVGAAIDARFFRA